MKQATIRNFWASHGNTILKIAIAIMTISAVVYLSYQFYKIFGFPPFESGGPDYNRRYIEIQDWFDGKTVYGVNPWAVYPPASYAILWPFMGWLPISTAQWFWTITTIIALIWIVSFCVRESGANTKLLRIFAGLMPLSMYATGSTIGHGQLQLHILMFLIIGLFLLRSEKISFFRDFLISILIIFSLVKPHVTAPFFWIVLFSFQRLRPAIMVILGYIVLSVVAASFQTSDMFSLTQEWLNSGKAGAEWAVEHNGGHNLHAWSYSFGLENYKIIISLIALGLLGLWIYHYRQSDFWILMGVTAIIARFWTYHLRYDDLLMLLPMIALFRLAVQKETSEPTDILAGFLLAITILTLLAPGGFHLLSKSWYEIYAIFKYIIWTVVLIFFMNHAWMRKNDKRRRSSFHIGRVA